MALTKEINFEDAIEKHLVEKEGYIKGDNDNFDRIYALDRILLFEFIKATQPKEWEKLSNIHKNKIEDNFLHRLDQELSNRGMLDVLRNGIVDYGIKFKLAYFKPASGMNQSILELYKKNLLSVTRQVHYSKQNENSLDMVVFINGLPFATIELKNQMSGQTVENAKKQYMFDRDPKELIFQFKKRALVHFAVDTDLIFMTTELKGKDTYFLPFNKGDRNGAGNPINQTGGYKTDYLWTEILAKDSLLDIVQRFLHLQVTEKTISNGKKIKKETMIFPRYHQLDVVKKLEADAKQVGAGKNYLIQHSAGSGKSNSIAWLSHRLASLHNEHDEAVFDSVVVITDRVVLNKQLQDTIYQFEHKQGVVEKIEKGSNQLAKALKNGSKIIITTLQTFPFVIEKIDAAPNKKYAVIVDEAHSSQSGEASNKLKQVLSQSDLELAAKEQLEEEEKEADYEEELIKAMLSRKQQKNLSFFAFTATPKQKTLEIFGQKSEDSKQRPFHLYSMRQAIEEGFILDVLKNYTTYNLFFKLSKEIVDDPTVNKKKAAVAIARFVSLHPYNLAQKTEIIIEHFRNVVKNKIGGNAKAMVVTSSRMHALRYKFEFDRYIKDKGYTDIGTLVAFSGVLKYHGVEYTEPDLNINKNGNKIKESELPAHFATGEYQVLLVADKYQTGFDQPLLHTMYVDKKLSGVKAVQTLSRLNRTCIGKEDAFVLDFVNKREDIEESFQPYYEGTTLAETTDPNKLYDLYGKISTFQICWDNEVEQFAKIFYKPKDKQQVGDQGKLNNLIDPAVDRYKQREEDVKDEFKELLTSFVRMYSFLTQIVPYFDESLEKFFVYGQYLLRKLPRIHQDDKYVVGDDVALKYYRLTKAGTFDGQLNPIEGELLGINDIGTAGEKEKYTELSKIIEAVNKRFETEFTEADQLFFEQVVQDCINDDTLRQQAQNNSKENFRSGLSDVLYDKVIDRQNQNEKMFKMIMDDSEFQKLFENWMLNEVYKRAQKMDNT